MSFLFDKVLDKIEEFILSASVIIMSLVLIGNVFARSIFNSSWTFAEEVGQFLVIIMTFMGISYAAKKARHISMSAIFDLVPDKIKKLMILLISGGTALCMFFLAYLATRYTLSVYELARVSPALRLPMWIFIMFVPLGFITAGIQYSRNFYKNITDQEIYVSDRRKLGEAEEDQTWS